jgi:hypothetical protein
MGTLAQDGTLIALASVAGIGLIALARTERGSAVLANEEIARAWRRGRPATGNRWHTDGRTLWSYRLVIGETNERGDKIVYDHTAPAGHGRSKTTSRHVNLAKRYADKVVNPSVKKIPRITGYLPSRDD